MEVERARDNQGAGAATKIRAAGLAMVRVRGGAAGAARAKIGRGENRLTFAG